VIIIVKQTYKMATDLSETSIQDIEKNIMTVLYSNTGKLYSQYTLYDEVLTKFDVVSESHYVSPRFKSKYMVVLKNLNSNFKDVKLTKELNTQTREYFYNVSIPDDEIVNIDSPSKNNENEKLKINTDEIIQDKDDKYWKTRVLFEYLFDNNLYESYKSDDDGNTIYHDLILSNSFIIVKKLIEQNKFDFDSKNKLDETPIDLLHKSSEEMNTLVLKSYITNMKSNIKNLEFTIKYLESSDYTKKIIIDTPIKTILYNKMNIYTCSVLFLGFVVFCLKIY